MTSAPGFLISIPPEPTRLLLSWRPPLYVKDRTHWVVGELTKEQQGASFRYYRDEEFGRINGQRSFAQLQEAGYRGYPTFNQETQSPKLFQEGALEAFLRRLPIASRSDYAMYLEHHFLAGSSRPGPFTLLSVTGARLPSDGFALVDPFDFAFESLDAVLEIVGVRHYYENFLAAEMGRSLILISEPNNEHDQHAVKFTYENRTVGFVGRLQAPAVAHWLKSGRHVEAWLVRRNAAQDAPRAFAFLRLRKSQFAQAA